MFYLTVIHMYRTLLQIQRQTNVWQLFLMVKFMLNNFNQRIIPQRLWYNVSPFLYVLKRHSRLKVIKWKKKQCKVPLQRTQYITKIMSGQGILTKVHIAVLSPSQRRMYSFDLIPHPIHGSLGLHDSAPKPFLQGSWVWPINTQTHDRHTHRPRYSL